MSRKARIQSISGMYHIAQRGNDQQAIFLDDSDRQFFLSKLKKYSLELAIEIYAYCLMSNHFHILLGNTNNVFVVSNFMKKLSNSYVYYFNKKYKRSGHLYQERFRSEPVEDEAYYKTVLRYILKNSETARVEKMDLYRWNSYKNLVKESSTGIIAKSKTLDIFGSIKNIIDFLSVDSNDKCLSHLNKPIWDKELFFETLKSKFGINSPYELTHLEPVQQQEKLQQLKALGIPIIVITRYTGIPRAVVSNA